MARHKTKLGFYKRFTCSSIPGTGWFVVDQVDKQAWGPYSNEEDDKAQWKRIQEIIEAKWHVESSDPDIESVEVVENGKTKEDEPKSKPEKLPARRASK